MSEKTGTAPTNSRTSETESSKKQKRDDFIRVKFVNQDNEETFIKVVRDAKLGGAFAAYAKHHNLRDELQYTFDGLRVNPNLTADDLNIKDGDAFDVHSHVHGGGTIIGFH